MDAELKHKWVDALRSGEYPQGEGQLRHGDKRCCWGVFMEVLEMKPVTVEGKEGVLSYQYPYKSTGSYQYPASALIEELGIDDKQVGILACHNDGACGYDKLNFDEIADYIDENL